MKSAQTAAGPGQPDRGAAPRGPGRARLAAVAGAAGVLAAASCGTATPAASPAAASSRVYEVEATTIPGLGRILADGSGRTLYLYTPDRQGPSVCARVCATAWPPLVLPRGVRRPVAGRGIDAALLGTVRRPGGALQVTYDKWPLYLYRNDEAPGQATGQAESMGLWYVVSVTGAIDRGTPS
jgi:predicted lipoprotein with Yx(FWY)xxD motif